MNFSLTNPTGPPAAPPPPALRDLPGLRPPAASRKRRKPGAKAAAAVAAVAVVVVGAVALGGVGKARLGNLFAGPSVDVITYPVRYANLPVVVSERGSLESSKNEDAYCQVEGQTTIIMIVSEGTRVTKGQVVCELDSSALKDALTNQVIATKGADAAYQNARLTREVAEIAVQEYEEGVYKQNLESCKIDIALAESDLKRAEDRLEWSDRMYKKGYVSLGQNMSERLALQRAKFALEVAQTKLNVLEKFTRNKTVKEFQSEVEKARSDELAKQSTWKLEQTKEEKLVRQIKNCKIIAPNDGLVVYANDPNRFGGSSQPQIEEGATVRERQKIFSLPDITKMRVNTKVHESMIDRIKPGLLARIKVDAFAEETLPGVVEDIAPLPDPSSFFSSDVKVYTTHVAIERGIGGLRPGMTAQVEILVIDVPHVLSVPVQAVLQFKGKDHLAVKTPTGFVWRDAVLGMSNDKLVEVKSGLSDGELVALSPVLLMSEAEKREAFGSSSDASKKGWAQAKSKVGVAPIAASLPGEPGKPKAKGKGAGMPPALREKMQAIPAEERAKMKGASQEEREAILKKGGFTEDEMKQLQQLQQQRMQRRAAEGGGGGFGGPGGGGGGGGFGGQGGPRP